MYISQNKIMCKIGLLREEYVQLDPALDIFFTEN